MDLDAVFILAGIIVQAALLALLIGKRVFRDLPVFVAYNTISLLSIILYFLLMRYFPSLLLADWAGQAIIDALLYLGVVAELSRGALRFTRSSSPSRELLFIFFVIAILFIWPAVRWLAISRFPLMWQFGYRIMQWTTIVQTAAFLALVCWSSLKKLRWPNREFHVVCGMGFWTFVSLCALMLRNDGFIGGAQNRWVELLAPVSYVLVMLWWIHYFWFEPSHAKRVGAPDAYEIAGVGSAYSSESRRNMPSIRQTPPI